MNYNKKTVYDIDVVGKKVLAALRLQRPPGQGHRRDHLG